MILKYKEFLVENKINEGSIPVYKGDSFNPVDSIKSSETLRKIQSLLDELSAGNIGEISIVAEIPTQGKNAPDYLKDIYRETGMEEDPYDEETDTYSSRKDYEETIFVDSDFVVVDVDVEKGVVLAEPRSLRNKGVVIEITPNKIEEIFIN